MADALAMMRSPITLTPSQAQTRQAPLAELSVVAALPATSQLGGGITYGTPSYGGQGYSAPYGISAPVSHVTQSPVFSPTLSPVTTSFAQAPDIYITQRETGVMSQPPSGMFGGDMMGYIVVGSLLAMMVAMVLMSRRR